MKKENILGILAQFFLRRDPYELATVTSNTYWDWYLDHAFLLLPAAEYVGRFLMTFKDFPPRMKAASFNLDNVMEQLKTSSNN
jgi:arylsulfatase